MQEQALIDLGLSRNESRVYISLLEIGSANMSKIAGASGIHRVNVYDSIRKLKEKGLVGQMSHDGQKNYQASPPEALRNIIKEKEIKLNQIIPQLSMSHSLAENSHQVQIFQGMDFIRNMFLHFLETKEDILDWNIPKFVLDQMGAHGMPGNFFQEEIHKRRAKQKQNMYHIYRRDAMERMKFLNTLPYTKARYLENEPESNVTTTICGDEVVIQIYKENNSEKPLIIHINNKDVAETYRQQFFMLWEIAHVPK